MIKLDAAFLSAACFVVVLFSSFLSVLFSHKYVHTVLNFQTLFSQEFDTQYTLPLQYLGFSPYTVFTKFRMMFMYFFYIWTYQK